MTGTQALVLTGVGVSFAVPWLGLAISTIGTSDRASNESANFPATFWSAFLDATVASG